MNIFLLDIDATRCARYHCDKHVVKMILEYAQLMSTAHRVLDGEMFTEIKNSRKIKRYKLTNIELNNNLYNATHINHPSAIWVRESRYNYFWLYDLWHMLLAEYDIRYNRDHKCRSLTRFLQECPKNIPFKSPTALPLCMPSKYQDTNDPVGSYRRYYLGEKSKFAKWKYCEIPYWYKEGIVV